MPLTAPRQCTHPGCREVHRDGGPCQKHKGAYDRWRGTSSQRGYGPRWRRERKAHLLREPLCRTCLIEDQVTQATQVDHIVPVSSGRTAEERYKLMWDPKNRQSQCHSHHSRKTATDDGGFGR